MDARDRSRPTLVPAATLQRFSREVFEHLGVPEAEATEAAAVLARSDLRGIDSHGVARLHTYFEMLSAGRINPRPRPRVVRENASTATLDGDNGLGLVVGPIANRMAMARADAVGSGWVSVCNTNHFGIAGYYVLEAVERGLVGMAMTNSTKLVAPHLGAQRMLGTNPVAFGFPAGDEPPIIVDLATSAVAYGKLEIARRRGDEIPLGWAIDRAGAATTHPEDMIDGGALTPLGSNAELSGHKGYCLAAAVDVLSAVLSGANWGPFAPPFTLRQEVPGRSVGKGIGHFFGAWQLDGFIDPAEFRARMDDWIRTFRGARPAPGCEAVLVPGDPERAAEQVREREGIPLLPAVLGELQDIARQTGIPLPLEASDDSRPGLS